MATFDTSLAYIQASGLSDDDQGLALAYLGANREQEIYTLANNPNAAVRLALFRSWAARERQQQAQGPGRTHFDSVVDGYIHYYKSSGRARPTIAPMRSSWPAAHC
eukprot:TRINITY_DN576_c0_g1_i4.p3 TRINITY_DN576_c0_g1~~TRINITY_DN576_c0_g1_i4.p3  ORF type:complete len:106 (-),score=6.18 TRINITY_DN576_c0_g1_i4:255-572(-)